MLCDGGVVRCSVKAEHRFIDLFLGEGLPGVDCQMLTDRIFAAGQPDGNLIMINQAFLQVKSQFPFPDPAVGVRLSRLRWALTLALSSVTRKGFIR